jgi:molybdate transport system ATP-binding protein
MTIHPHGTIHLDGRVSRGDFDLDVDIRIDAAEVVAILGPNGSGKSTLLRTLCGLQPLSSGTLCLGDTMLDDSGGTFVPPQKRECGVVFQDYALFPHQSVLENVAFGLRAHKVPREIAKGRAATALERLGIADLADRRPSQVSGGQAQRIALARALAPDPTMLLLDEPMAALDVDTRDVVRGELDSVLSSFEGCAVLVTHDPVDAMVLADRVVVLENGRVVQSGPPTELAERPATEYVAALMGVTLLRGSAANGLLEVDGGGRLRIADAQAQGRVLCVVRPESVTLHRHQPEGSARNAWSGTIAAVQPSHDRVRIVVDGHPRITAAVTHAAVADLGLVKGASVWVSMKAVDLHSYASPAH